MKPTPAQRLATVAIFAAIGFALVVYLFPIYWIAATSLKPFLVVSAWPPKFVFTPTLDNYLDVIYNRVRLGNGTMDVRGLGEYPGHLLNSVIVGSVSTLLAVSLGTLTAYAFSRFKVKGKNDWLFFILSTRMLPPVVVVIPIFLMYRAVGLIDTRFGLILLYTTFNLSFAVWLMKGFMDEIPKEYEEAALLDGYSRFQAFRKVVLPQAITAIAATAVFCLITAWNEFAFSLLLTTQAARTAPPSIPNLIGSSGLQWGQIAAATFMFLLPVAIFTFLMRNHLLRGITFGAIKK